MGLYFFVPGKDLRAIIFESLKQGDKSISKLTRDLKAKGHDYHRLVVTGYLKALADLGVVKEKAIPPSKVYCLPAQKRRNIYELIGEHAKVRELGYKKEGLLCVQVLESIFKRPIFQSELALCGYEEPQGVRKATKEERADARVLVSAAGIKISSRENAFLAKRPFMEEVNEVLLDLVVDMSGTRSLRKGTKQTTLEL